MSRRRGPGPAGVLIASAGAFAAVFAGLAFQLGDGRDPAVGAGKASRPVVAVAPRRVLIRRVIERRVIVHVIPAAEDSSAPTAPARVPVVTSSAPAPAAAAPPVRATPAPAPPPAPAPAAPVTRAS